MINKWLQLISTIIFTYEFVYLIYAEKTFRIPMHCNLATSIPIIYVPPCLCILKSGSHYLHRHENKHKRDFGDTTAVGMKNDRETSFASVQNCLLTYTLVLTYL